MNEKYCIDKKSLNKMMHILIKAIESPSSNNKKVENGWMKDEKDSIEEINGFSSKFVSSIKTDHGAYKYTQDQLQDAMKVVMKIADKITVGQNKGDFIRFINETLGMYINRHNKWVGPNGRNLIPNDIIAYLDEMLLNVQSEFIKILLKDNYYDSRPGNVSNSDISPSNPFKSKKIHLSDDELPF